MLSPELNKLKADILKELRDEGVPEYDHCQLERGRSFGKGGSGAKADVSWLELDNGQLVAVKCFSKKVQQTIAESVKRVDNEVIDGSRSEKADGECDVKTQRRNRVLQYFKRECLVMRKLSNQLNDPHIVKLFGFSERYHDSLLPCLVMDLYGEGNLRYFISTRRASLSERIRVKLLMDIASGLAHLHRDIKGVTDSVKPAASVSTSNMVCHKQNILVKKLDGGELSAAIGDFGSAKLLDPGAFTIQQSSFATSVAWLPPEYIRDGRPNYSAPTIFGDIWSFACTVLEVMSDSDPWSGHHDIIMRLSNGDHPPRPRSMKEDSYYWTFARSCFLPPAANRPVGRLLESKLAHVYKQQLEP